LVGGAVATVGTLWAERRKRVEAFSGGMAETYRQLLESLDAYPSASGERKTDLEKTYREMWWKTMMHQDSKARQLVKELGSDLGEAAIKADRDQLLLAMQRDAGRAPR
jgi:hypothetical protein